MKKFRKTLRGHAKNFNVILIGMDQIPVSIPLSIAIGQIEFIRGMIESYDDITEDIVITNNRFKSDVFHKVYQFCTNHVNNHIFENISIHEMIDLFNLALFLEIPQLQKDAAYFLLHPKNMRYISDNDIDCIDEAYVGLTGRHYVDEYLMFNGGNLKLYIKLGVGLNSKDLLQHCLTKYSRDNYQYYIDSLLHKGVNINQFNSFGETILHFAIAHYHIEIFLYLLSRGSDILKKDVRGISPLSKAIQYGKNEYVSILYDKYLESGNSIQIHEKPLHVAIVFNQYKIIELLLQKGLNINVVNEQNETALHLAITHGTSEAVIKLLVENGSNLIMLNKKGMTPLHESIRLDYFSAFEIITNRYVLLRQKIDSYDVPLHQAIYYGRIQMVERLIQLGCDIHLQANAYGGMPLFLTIDMCYKYKQQGHSYSHYIQMIQLLLSNGVNVKKRNENQLLPIEYAEERGLQDIVQNLKLHSKRNARSLDDLYSNDEYINQGRKLQRNDSY